MKDLNETKPVKNEAEEVVEKIKTLEDVMDRDDSEDLIYVVVEPAPGFARSTPDCYMDGLYIPFGQTTQLPRKTIKRLQDWVDCGGRKMYKVQTELYKVGEWNS